MCSARGGREREKRRERERERERKRERERPQLSARVIIITTRAANSEIQASQRYRVCKNHRLNCS